MTVKNLLVNEDEANTYINIPLMVEISNFLLRCNDNDERLKEDLVEDFLAQKVGDNYEQDDGEFSMRYSNIPVIDGDLIYHLSALYNYEDECLEIFYFIYDPYSKEARD